MFLSISIFFPQPIPRQQCAAKLQHLHNYNLFYEGALSPSNTQTHPLDGAGLAISLLASTSFRSISKSAGDFPERAGELGMETTMFDFQNYQCKFEIGISELSFYNRDWANQWLPQGQLSDFEISQSLKLSPITRGGALFGTE